MMPYVISATIALLIMTTLSFFIPDKSQAHSTFIVGLIVFFVIIAMPVYNIESWSLLKKTIVHILAMLATVLPYLVLSGWFDISNWRGIDVMLVTYVCFGVVGWTIGFCLINKVITWTKYVYS